MIGVVCFNVVLLDHVNCPRLHKNVCFYAAYCLFRMETPTGKSPVTDLVMCP